MNIDFIIWIIVGATTLVISIAAFICTFIRTGSVKKSVNAATEVLKGMKQRLPNYRESEPASAHEFSELVPNYVYNEETKELEVIGQRNIQKEIDSHADCALDKILSRLLPDEYGLTGFAGGTHIGNDDYETVYCATTPLDDLNELNVWADDMAEKYGLDDSASLRDVIAAINKAAQSDAKAAAQLVAPVADTAKKGGETNAQTSPEQTN